MPDKYPTSEGAVFINDRKNKETHPDWRGHLDITKAQIDQLVRMGRSGQKVRLQIAAWDRESGSGKEYMYLKAEAYMKDEDEGGDDWGNDNQSQRRSHGRSAQRGTSAHRRDEPAQDDFADDDIPF